MGKRGGKRPGAGRPRKQHLTVVAPSVAAAATVPKVTAGQVPPAPSGLSELDRAVWVRLAPDAYQAGTLTDATAADFAATCQLAVLADVSHAAVRAQTAGTPEWVQMSRIYLAYARDLAVKLRAFRLAPNGLPMVVDEKPAEKPKSPLELLKARRAAMKVV